MQKLQSYIKQVKKDYAFEVQLDNPMPTALLEKKLSDLGITALVEKPEGNPGQYQMVLSYPITGQELLARVCENSTSLVTVHDETGQVYSNHPIPKPAPENLSERLAPQVVAEPAPVVEIKKPVATQEQLTESAATVATMVTESLVKNLEDLRQQMQTERASDTRYQQFNELKTSATISAMNENIVSLQSVLVQISSDIAKLNNTVNEAMHNYSKKLTELAESSNRLNHRVVKHVERDENGNIMRVTEQIETEK
jgi:hypothetical protein